VQQAMNSHLQSNGATQAAKVDNLMPSAIFHSFQTKMTLKKNTRTSIVEALWH
jgi:hypothetical protein